MLPKVKTKRTKTPEQALSALMRLAARAERSSGDALRLMRNWGVEPQEQSKVLQKLVEMKFIDDARYAQAFVRDKMRFSGWGAYKIRAALRTKGIEAATIDEAIGAVDSRSSAERLAALLEKKSRTVKYASVYELKNKLTRYAASLGYDFETIADAVAQTLKNDDTCSDF